MKKANQGDQSQTTIIVSKNLQFNSQGHSLSDWSDNVSAVGNLLTISDHRFAIKRGDQIRFNALVKLPEQNLWKACGTEATGWSHAAARVKAAKTLTVRIPSHSQENAKYLWGTVIDHDYSNERRIAVTLSPNQQNWLQDQGGKPCDSGLLTLHGFRDAMWNEIYKYISSRGNSQNMDVLHAVSSHMKEGLVLVTLVDPHFKEYGNERRFIQYGDSDRNFPVYEAAALGIEPNLAMYANPNTTSFYRAPPLEI